jgi:hypothetical protein
VPCHSISSHCHRGVIGVAALALSAGCAAIPVRGHAFQLYRAPFIGVREMFSYDGAGRVTADTVRTVLDQLLRATEFTYGDARGKVTRSRNAAFKRDSLTAAYSGLGFVVASSRRRTATSAPTGAVSHRTSPRPRRSATTPWATSSRRPPRRSTRPRRASTLTTVRGAPTRTIRCPAGWRVWVATLVPIASCTTRTGTCGSSTRGPRP